MKYIGNKTRLLSFIEKSMHDAGIPFDGTFIDIFGGTGSVGAYFKRKGFKIVSNDIMSYSYFAQYLNVYISVWPLFNRVSSNGIDGVLDILNNPKLMKKGFVFDNFAPSGKFGRQYFSDTNAQRIDAIRDQIELWKNNNKISEKEYIVLVALLVDAADFVANISGTYGAYLKIWRSMALKPIILKKIELYNSYKDNEIYQEDANILIKHICGDVLYLDPPYNERQYAPNFHVLETLTVWDSPKLSGKTGQRDYSNKKSLYCQRNKAAMVLRQLVLEAKVKYIILSYNNEGIISREEIIKILSSRGQLREYKQEYRRFRTEKDSDNRHYKDCGDRVYEHLYIVKTDK